jgi:hypothetical protein
MRHLNNLERDPGMVENAIIVKKLELTIDEYVT